MENELPRITYLFGAGASALKLPTVKELPKRIKAIKQYFNDNYNYGENEKLTHGHFKVDAIAAKKFILDGFDKLYNASQNHSTIDTYAKKLRITDRRLEVEELSLMLALYFNFEQKLVGNDPRYDTFLISILDYSALFFPNNLRFLSWNYDLQFEMAYGNLIGTDDRFMEFSRFNSNEIHWKKDEFTCIKINGSCKILDDFKGFFDLMKHAQLTESSRNYVEYALQYGMHKIKIGNPSFPGKTNVNFAWYKDPLRISKIADLHSDTEVLVVIGYSFPFFNREVDRTIIRAMNNLKFIYIQDKSPENIMSRFLSILPDWKKRGIEIIPINSTDEFFLPPQL